MRFLGTGLMVAAVLGLGALPARGQVYVQWYPVDRPAQQAMALNGAPASADYAPAAGASTTVSTRWEPAEPATPTAAGYPAAVNYPPAPTYAPAVTYAPVASYPPAVNYVPTANYAPAVRYVASPAYVPLTTRCVTPTVSYMPVVARYPAPTYVTYAPAPTGYVTAAAPVSAGPKVWVHPKVYVEGQPIRNLIRAVTP